MLLKTLLDIVTVLDSFSNEALFWGSIYKHIFRIVFRVGEVREENVNGDYLTFARSYLTLRADQGISLKRH